MLGAHVDSGGPPTNLSGPADAAVVNTDAGSGDYSDSPKAWQQCYKGFRERFVDDCCITLGEGGPTIRLLQAPAAHAAPPGSKQGITEGDNTPRLPKGARQQQQRGQAAERAQQQWATRPRTPTTPQLQPPQKGIDRRSDPALTGTTVWDGSIVLSQYLATTSALQQWLSDWHEHTVQPGCRPQAIAAAPHTHQQQAHPEQDAQHDAQPMQQQAPGHPAPGDKAGATARQLPWPSGRASPLVLELGAGTGAVSLCLLASAAASAAILTDLPGMLPHLQRNVHHNAAALGGRRALVRALRWGDAGADAAALAADASLPPPPYDVIVGADLVYYSYSSETPHSRLLLEALERLATPGATVVFLALSLQHNPGEVGAFLLWAAAWGWVVQQVPLRQLPDGYRVSDALVVRMHLPAGHVARPGGVPQPDSVSR